MNIPFEPVMPLVFDIAHLGLLATLLILVMCLIFRPKAKAEQPPVQEALSAPKEALDQGLLTCDETGALQLLALLQRDGRLLDFIHEDVSQYSDQEIGGAARVVHEGLKKTLSTHFEIQPIETAHMEGEAMSVPEDFDTQAIQLVGNVTGNGPFQGTLVHPGWQLVEAKLPKVSHHKNQNILAPAQVEV